MKSEEIWTIENLFSGRPASRRLFDLVRKHVESFGQVKTEVTKTQVSFGVNRKFA